MSKQVLSIEQMQHLQDLGLDISKASMCWLKDITKEIAEEKYVDMTTGWNLDFNNPDFYKYEWMYGVSAFTLQDILDLLPEEIEKGNRNYQLEAFRNPQRYFVSYYWCDNLLISLNEVEFIDAAYEMLCWCIENRYVKTDKEK